MAFVSAMLTLVGLFNIIYGLAAIANDDVLTSGSESARALIGNLESWGVVILVLGVVQVAAGAAVLTWSQWARWFGIVVAALAAIGQVPVLAAFPVWSLIIIGLCVLVIYGLAVYGAEPGASG